MMDVPGYRLNILHDGTTYFSSVALQPPRGSADLVERSEKGLSTISCSNNIESKCYFREKVLCVVVIGEKETYICKNCKNKIAKKAKAREDFPKITFCSMECLEESMDFLDICGPIFTALDHVSSGNWLSVVHIIKLAVHYIYSILTCTSSIELARLLSALRLESHEHIVCSELKSAAEWLFNQVHKQLSPQDILELSYKGLYLGKHGTQTIESEYMILYRLLLIIKYNAQPLPVYGVPQVQLLCLLPSIARVNHSCKPNATLVYDITYPYQSSVKANSHTGVYVSLVGLRGISVGEEITVSYLRPLCSPVQTRWDLLQQGFAFTCRCERCIVESEATQHSRMHANTYHLSVSKLENALNTSAAAMTSSGKELLIQEEELEDLMTTVENCLTSSYSDKPIDEPTSCLKLGVVDTLYHVSLIHDCATLVLERAQRKIKQLTVRGNNNTMSLTSIVARAQLALICCWKSIDCANTLQCIELVVSSAQSMARICQSGYEKLCSGTMKEYITGELLLSIEALSTIYTSYISTGSVELNTNRRDSADVGIGGGSGIYCSGLLKTANQCLIVLRQ